MPKTTRFQRAILAAELDGLSLGIVEMGPHFLDCEFRRGGDLCSQYVVFSHTGNYLKSIRSILKRDPADIRAALCMRFLLGKDPEMNLEYPQRHIHNKYIWYDKIESEAFEAYEESRVDP
jgi:hypothetical protein